MLHVPELPLTDLRRVLQSETRGGMIHGTQARCVCPHKAAEKRTYSGVAGTAAEAAVQPDSSADSTDAGAREASCWWQVSHTEPTGP